MKQFKHIFTILLFITTCSLFAQVEQTKSSLPKFIIIANIGNSNYFIAPLVVSVDSIADISYTKGIYDLHAKYKGFRNIVVSRSDYEKLFLYLNMYQNCEKRPEKFIKEEHAALIIDYRDSANTDCQMLTQNSISAILYTLKNLQCYLEANNFDKEIVAHIKRLYTFYIDTYDYKKELYKAESSCE